jgi:hypothetical protein
MLKSRCLSVGCLGVGCLRLVSLSPCHQPNHHIFCVIRDKRCAELEYANKYASRSQSHSSPTLSFTTNLPFRTLVAFDIQISGDTNTLLFSSPHQHPAQGSGIGSRRQTRDHKPKANRERRQPHQDSCPYLRGRSSFQCDNVLFNISSLSGRNRGDRGFVTGSILGSDEREGSRNRKHQAGTAHETHAKLKA